MRRLITLNFLTGIILFLFNFIYTACRTAPTGEYADLGKFQADPERGFVVSVPYYKPGGITIIPSEYFRALVIHELRADGKRILPKRLYPIWWTGADGNVRGLLLDDTAISEAAYLTLEIPWLPVNDEAIKQGVVLSSYSRGEKNTLFHMAHRKYHYFIAYGF
jgi:hypothetical protein